MSTGLVDDTPRSMDGGKMEPAQAPWGTGKNWRTATPGTAPLRHLNLSPADEAARQLAPSAMSGYCVDELCACSLHKCTVIPPSLTFDAESTYRTEYRVKEIPKPIPAKPMPPHVSLPFDAETSYRTQYKKWAMPQLQAPSPVAYQPAPESRTFGTESRSQFCPKELPQKEPLAPSPEYRTMPFDATTTYRTQFLPKDIPRQVPPKPVSLPASLPFDGTTAYREQFVSKAIPKMAEVVRPDFQTAPETRDFSTQYRTNFKGVIPEVCPVSRLPPFPAQRYPREHSFWDTVDKKWY